MIPIKLLVFHFLGQVLGFYLSLALIQAPRLYVFTVVIRVITQMFFPLIKIIIKIENLVLDIN